MKTVKERLMEVLEEVELPRNERRITDEEAGASVMVVGANEGMTTILKPNQKGWIEVTTDWDRYADLLLQHFLAEGLQLIDVNEQDPDYS